jgi:hypothetical protein
MSLGLCDLVRAHVPGLAEPPNGLFLAFSAPVFSGPGATWQHIWSVMTVTYLRDGCHLSLPVLNFSVKESGDGVSLSDH